jgi:hypothetical protein
VCCCVGCCVTCSSRTIRVRWGSAYLAGVEFCFFQLRLRACALLTQPALCVSHQPRRRRWARWNNNTAAREFVTKKIVCGDRLPNENGETMGLLAFPQGRILQPSFFFVFEFWFFQISRSLKLPNILIHITLASFSFILKRRRIKRAPGFPFCCLSLSSSYSLYCLLHLFPVIANRSREHHTMEQTSVVVV